MSTIINLIKLFVDILCDSPTVLKKSPLKTNVGN